MTAATAQSPAIISQADLDALRASIVVAKEGGKFIARLPNGDIVATKGKKAAAEQAAANYIPDFTVIEAIQAPTNPQEPAMTETTETPDLPVIHATLVLPEGGDTPEAPAEAPALTEEEQAAADKAAARSQKLREAMAAVLAKPYDETVQAETHPSFKTKRGLYVQLEGQDECPENPLPAVLYHRTMDSFSEKSRVEGVTFNGKPVGAARTRGTWRGLKTSFLWIEAPRLDFPASMVGASSKEYVTFHLLIENDDWDNLEGAAVTAPADAEQAPIETAPKAEKKAPWDKPTPTEDAEQPTPAKRAPKERPAADAQA